MFTVCTVGKTRIVILTNLYAIKIARFSPARPFIRLAELVLRGGGVRENVVRHSPNKDFFKGAINYLFYGVVANLREYRMYKTYAHTGFLAPTVFTFFGLVNIQIRGEAVKDKDLHLFPLAPILGADIAGAETMRSDQFCLIDSCLHLADYGNQTIEDFFARWSQN